MAVMDIISFLTEVSPMTAPARKPYLTDLTDDQWDILQPHIPTSKPGGRPREVDMREVINTILYLNRTGCQWDMLPHDLLPKSTVYEYFPTWHLAAHDGRVARCRANVTGALAGAHPKCRQYR
jgi:putative transposase